MFRGIERRDIFADDADREDLLERLDHLVPALGFRCYAWALMPNHVHLVLRSSAVSISRLMARLCTGYAVAFNRRHARVGHLLQNRFRSRIVVDDADLRGLVLYVHRNPLRARIVRDERALAGFAWCGHGALLGERSPRAFEATRDVLCLFAGDERDARVRLERELADVSAHSSPWAAATREGDAPRSVAPTRRDVLEALIEGEALGLGVTPAELRSRTQERRVTRARLQIASRAVNQLGIAPARVAEAFRLRPSAITNMLKRRRSSVNL